MTDQQLDIDNIPIVEPKSLIDVTGYEGKRFPIDTVERIEVIDYYNGPTDDGSNTAYNPNSTEKKFVIEIKTVPLPELDENGEPTDNMVDLGDGKKLTVNARFNLKKEMDEKTGQVNWVISKHPKANLWKFMRKFKVDKLGDLKGKFVTLTTVPAADENDDRLFLRIVQ